MPPSARVPTRSSSTAAAWWLAANNAVYAATRNIQLAGTGYFRVYSPDT